VFDIITCVIVITFAKYQEKNMGNASTKVEIQMAWCIAKPILKYYSFSCSQTLEINISVIV